MIDRDSYAPFGPATDWTYGDGRTMQRPMDLNYRATRIEDSGNDGLSLGYGYDPVGQIVPLDDVRKDLAIAGYGYDALGRLTQVRDGASVLEQYGYDLTGNRTWLGKAAGTHQYGYIGGSHRLSDDGIAIRDYDAAGNTTVIKYGSSRLTFAYNDAGRMQQARFRHMAGVDPIPGPGMTMRVAPSASAGLLVDSRAAGTPCRADYVYNGVGERVRRIPDIDDTYTLHDEAGQWLGDYAADGSPIQQVIWLDDLLVGVLEGDGASVALYHIQPDHLGTPRAVLDPSRDVALWRWDLQGEAFGATPPDEDPDRDGVSFVLDMRYPGQRYDSIRGLQCNFPAAMNREMGDL